MRTLVPPLTKEGSPIDFKKPTYLAPGVLGYAIKVKDGRIWIPDIRAEKPGNGDVARFLDSVAPHVCFVNVVSAAFRHILRARGWLPTNEGVCDVWQRPRD